jgi:diguanylate cyclase (GGDEF)-like protein
MATNRLISMVNTWKSKLAFTDLGMSKKTTGSSHFLTEWLLLLGSLLIIGGVLAYGLYGERVAIDERERDHLTTQAKAVHDNLGRELEAINRVLVSIRDDLPFFLSRNDGMQLANHQLRALKDAMPSVRTLTIIDAAGTVVASSRDELLGVNVRQRAYFQAAERQPDPDTLYLGTPYKTILGVWAMNVVRLAVGQDGGIAMLLSATLDPEQFNILLRSVRYAADMRVALNHGDGEIFLTAPPREDIYGKNLLQPGSFYSRHVASGRAVNLFTGTIYSTGEERMAVLHTIQPPALKMDKALVVAASRHIPDLYANWHHDAQIRSGLFALLALSSISGLYLLQRRQSTAERDAIAAQAAMHEKNQLLEQLNAQLKAQSELLHAQAFIDGLTGIANRRRFNEALAAEWRRCRRNGSALALLMIDIDHFKLLNDHYGHPAGDACLQSVALVLKEYLGRSHDLVARYGGEEFVCLLPDSNLAGARGKAEALRLAIQGLGIPHETSPTADVVTISIGVAAWIPDGETSHDHLLAAADAALYAAKKGGRNRTCDATTVAPSCP